VLSDFGDPLHGASPSHATHSATASTSTTRCRLRWRATWRPSVTHAPRELSRESQDEHEIALGRRRELRKQVIRRSVGACVLVDRVRECTVRGTEDVVAHVAVGGSESRRNTRCERLPAIGGHSTVLVDSEHRDGAVGRCEVRSKLGREMGVTLVAGEECNEEHEGNDEVGTMRMGPEESCPLTQPVQAPPSVFSRPRWESCRATVEVLT
jgi:hypothetical protein